MKHVLCQTYVNDWCLNVSLESLIGRTTNTALDCSRLTVMHWKEVQRNDVEKGIKRANRKPLLSSSAKEGSEVGVGSGADTLNDEHWPEVNHPMIGLTDSWIIRLVILIRFWVKEHKPWKCDENWLSDQMVVIIADPLRQLLPVLQPINTCIDWISHLRNV